METYIKYKTQNQVCQKVTLISKGLQTAQQNGAIQGPPI